MRSHMAFTPARVCVSTSWRPVAHATALEMRCVFPHPAGDTMSARWLLARSWATSSGINPRGDLAKLLSQRADGYVVNNLSHNHSQLPAHGDVLEPPFTSLDLSFLSGPANCSAHGFLREFGSDPRRYFLAGCRQIATGEMGNV